MGAFFKGALSNVLRGAGGAFVLVRRPFFVVQAMLAAGAAGAAAARRRAAGGRVPRTSRAALGPCLLCWGDPAI